MGVRLYDPNLGRFLEVDSIEGGNANDYIYPADPVNMYDLDGNVSSACAVTLYKRRAGAKTAKTGQRIACGDGTTYVVPPPTFSSLWDDFGYAWNAFVKAAKALQPDTKALFRTALLLLKTALTVLDKQPFKPPLPPYVPHPCKASAMWCPPPQA